MRLTRYAIAALLSCLPLSGCTLVSALDDKQNTSTTPAEETTTIDSEMPRDLGATADLIAVADLPSDGGNESDRDTDVDTPDDGVAGCGGGELAPALTFTPTSALRAVDMIRVRDVDRRHGFMVAAAMSEGIMVRKIGRDGQPRDANYVTPSLPARALSLVEIDAVALAGHDTPGVTSLIYSARYRVDDTSAIHSMLVRQLLAPMSFAPMGDSEILYELEPAANSREEPPHLVNLVAHVSEGNLVVAWRELPASEGDTSAETELKVAMWSSAAPASATLLAAHDENDPCYRSPADASIDGLLSSGGEGLVYRLAWFDNAVSKATPLCLRSFQLDDSGSARDLTSIMLNGPLTQPKTVDIAARSLLFVQESQTPGGPNDIMFFELDQSPAPPKPLATGPRALRQPRAIRLVDGANGQSAALLMWQSGNALRNTVMRTPWRTSPRELAATGDAIPLLSPEDVRYRLAADKAYVAVATFTLGTISDVAVHLLTPDGKAACPM